MNRQKILQEVKRIGALADDEAQHSAEDELWAAVLEAIAAGEPNPDRLAAAALRTRLLNFERWCA